MDRDPALAMLIQHDRERRLRADHLVAIAECARRCCTGVGRLGRIVRVLRPTTSQC